MKSVLVIAETDDILANPAVRVRLTALVAPMERRGFFWDIHARPKSFWGRVALMKIARRRDAVVLQRKWLDPYELRILKKNLRSGARITMDIDDATMYHERQLGYIANRRFNRRIDATIANLDFVCAGNGYLAEYFQQRGCRALVIPTVVDPADYRVKKHAVTTAPRLVWIGSSIPLKYLEELMPILAAAAKEVPGLRLAVICSRQPANPGLPVDFLPWSLETEAASLLAGDIGIAPLPNDKWTRGKCGFKIVQCMAAGLPVIASPVGVNADLVSGGAPGRECGFLAETMGEWVRGIKILAGDVALREKMGAVARQRVEQELCIEKIADQWAEALT